MGLAISGQWRNTVECMASAVLDWRGVLTQINSTWFQGKLAVEPHVKFPKLKSSATPKH